SQQSINSAVFDGVNSVRSSVTTDLFAAFPVPPKRPFHPSLDAPPSIHESLVSQPSTSRPSTSRRTSSTLDHPSPLPPSRAEIFTSAPSGLGISSLSLSSSQMELIPTKRLFDKDKGPGIFFIDISP